MLLRGGNGPCQEQNVRNQEDGARGGDANGHNLLLVVDLNWTPVLADLRCKEEAGHSLPPFKYGGTPTHPALFVC